MTFRKSPTKQTAQQYDITVKELLQAAPPKLLQLIWGTQPVEILTVDFPKVRMRHPDFVVRTKRGDIEQLEVQSDNDDDMEWRMLEYYPLLRKLFGRPPIQRVLYIGQKPLKMIGHIDEPNLQFRYEVIDLRQIDAELLLKSKSVEDRIFAILCHADNAQTNIRRILHSLSPLPAKIQGDKIEQLLYTAFPLFISAAAFLHSDRRDWWPYVIGACSAGLVTLTALYGVFGAIP